MNDPSTIRNAGLSNHSDNVVDTEWCNRLHGLLEQKTGLVLTQSRSMVSHLLQDRLKTLGLSDFEDYFSLLSNPAGGKKEWPNLLSRLTVNESYFFRDLDQLSVVENHLIPELLSQNGKDRDLTLWSAGCASGEETYTLAIILNNLLSESADLKRRIQILGTDIDANCIKQARQGCFRSWSFRHLPRNILATCFNKEEDDTYRIDPRLAANIQFMELNLLEAGETLAWKFRFDLVLCRNVFIYLSPLAVQRILAEIHTLMMPGGYLVTGHGEVDRQLMEKSGYVVRTFPQTQVYQKPASEGCYSLGASTGPEL
ncbi:MAG: protein-glutamate O-methyltransferase CheR [Magnetococcales bacterium]|nr:protein-glutamate O-methyltransferase CheR [Magnetococcales bacterium]